MYQEIDEFVINCDSCEMIDNSQNNVRQEFTPVELPHKPWEKIAVGIKGPLDGPVRY